MTTLRRLAPRSFATVCEELDHRSTWRSGSSRIRALLEKLENPHEELKIVQVVGMSGKEITAVALAGALEAAGGSAVPTRGNTAHLAFRDAAEKNGVYC